MAEKKLEGYVPPHPGVSVPLRGYLINEADDQMCIQDALGTWIVNTADVIGRGQWSGSGDSRFVGTPGIFHLRDGAEILEVRTVRIKAAQDWPLAIGEVARVSDLRGYTEVDALAAEHMDHLGLQLTAGAPRPRPTYSPAPDTTGWGMVIHRDDSAYQ